jgi:hypothetical protein
MLICVWHSMVSIIDNFKSFTTILGDTVITLDSYNNQLRQQNALNSLVDPITNITMIEQSSLSIAEKCDRIALIIFMALYFIFHVVFIMWLYCFVKLIFYFFNQIFIFNQNFL